MPMDDKPIYSVVVNFSRLFGNRVFEKLTYREAKIIYNALRWKRGYNFIFLYQGQTLEKGHVTRKWRKSHEGY